MRFTMALAATAAYLASRTEAKLDKPVIKPPFPNDGHPGFDPDLNANLPITKHTVAAWDAGWIPQDCKNIVERAGYNAADVTTFEIRYDDCKDPWIFCRHKDSPMPSQQFADTWGRLPVHSRQFVRHMVFLPGEGGSAGSSGDNVRVNGNLGVGVFIHEVAHSVDAHGFPDVGPFSFSQVWLDAYNKDTAVPDSYAQNSQPENYAELTVVALYDLVVPGGVAKIQPNYRAIINQYSTIQQYGADIITPGGECTARLVNSPPVQISTSFRTTTPKPDVSLSPGLKVIEAIPMNETMVMRDIHGKVVSEEVVKTGV